MFTSELMRTGEALVGAPANSHSVNILTVTNFGESECRAGRGDTYPALGNTGAPPEHFTGEDL